MLISIVSDTHGDIEAMRNSLGRIKNSDALIHLGDNVRDVEFYSSQYEGTIYNVKGNCDLSVKIQGEKFIELDGKKILLVHGHNYNVKEGLINLQYKAEEAKAEIVLYGHTHIPSIDFNNGIWYVNPGSLSKPRFRTKTFANIEIKQGRIIPYIVEL